jgi:hypothetical protein
MTVESFGKKQSARGEISCHNRVKQLRERNQAVGKKEVKKYFGTEKHPGNRQRAFTLNEMWSAQANHARRTRPEGQGRRSVRKNRSKSGSFKNGWKPDKSLRERLFMGSS